MFLVLFTLLLATVSPSLTSDIFDLPCTDDSSCDGVDGATCNLDLGSCMCPGFAVISGDMQTCLPVAEGAGATCTEDTQCSSRFLIGGACVEGICACIDGMHYHSGRCWPTKELGAPCLSDQECQATIASHAVQCLQNTTGGESFCSCAPGSYQKEYSDCRPEVLVLGGLCAVNSDCRMNGSFCSDNSTCECLDGSGQHGDIECGGPAFLILDFDEEIFEYENVYDEELTQIRSNFTSRGFGEECIQPEDCALEHAMCTPLGYCVCEQGYFFSADDGACRAETSGSCVTKEDCAVLGNAECTNEKCTCLVGYAETKNRDKCIEQVKLYNRKCKENAECSLFGPRAACLGKTCKCQAMSYFIESVTFCWVAKVPGDSCKLAQDCFVGGSKPLITCDEEAGVCRCLAGYHPSTDGKTCNKDAPKLGDFCSESGDCFVNNTACSPKHVCVCLEGYYEQDAQCNLGVGGQCKIAEDCSIVDLSDCVDNKCECPAGFISSADIKACLPESEGEGGECSEVQQCTSALGEFAACTERACTCAKKHHIVDGKCTPSRGIHESCTRSTDCYLRGDDSGLVCRNYKCECDYGYHASADKTTCESAGSKLQSSVILLTLVAAILGHYLN